MKKINLPLIVVLIILIEGLSIYLNMLAHPQSQPGLTIFIVLLLALIFGIVMTILTRKNETVIYGDVLKRNKDRFKYGIGFWAGAGVYSLINLLMNANKVEQSKMLFYNYLITGVAVLGLILNLILWKKGKKQLVCNNNILKCNPQLEILLRASVQCLQKILFPASPIETQIKFNKPFCRKKIILHLLPPFQSHSHSIVPGKFLLLFRSALPAIAHWYLHSF